MGIWFHERRSEHRMRCVHRSQGPPQGLGKVLKASEYGGICLLGKHACVLVSRITEFVEGKADLSYLERCLNGPCVEEGIGFNLMFCSNWSALLSCLTHIFSQYKTSNVCKGCKLHILREQESITNGCHQHKSADRCYMGGP